LAPAIAALCRSFWCLRSGSAMFSHSVIESKSVAFWNTMPMRRRTG